MTLNIPFRNFVVVTWKKKKNGLFVCFPFSSLFPALQCHHPDANLTFIFIILLLLPFLCSSTLTQFSIFNLTRFHLPRFARQQLFSLRTEHYFFFLFFSAYLNLVGFFFNFFFFTERVTENFGHWSSCFHFLLWPLKQPPLLGNKMCLPFTVVNSLHNKRIQTNQY